MAINGTGMEQIFKTALTSNETTAQEELGTIRVEHDSTYGLKAYMYVKAGGAIATGTPVTNMGVSGYTVGAGAPTTDLKGRRRVVGFGIGTITSGSYGWIQIRGHHTAALKHVKYCTTQHYANLVYLCGKLKGRNDNKSALTSSELVEVAEFTPYTSKTSACTTVSGYISCW